MMFKHLFNKNTYNDEKYRIFQKLMLKEYEDEPDHSIRIERWLLLLNDSFIDPTMTLDLYTGYLTTIAKRNDIDIDTKEFVKIHQVLCNRLLHDTDNMITVESNMIQNRFVYRFILN